MLVEALAFEGVTNLPFPPGKPFDTFGVLAPRIETRPDPDNVRRSVTISTR